MTGWFPLLICDNQSVTKQFKVHADTAKPWIWTMDPGGWAIGGFDYQDMYNEHRAYRNTWSASNTGLDLVRYRGADIFLYAHQYYTYVFHWDTDFNDVESFKRYCHPAILMNTRHHKVVMPLSVQGRKVHKIRIHPPSGLLSGWKQSKEFATAGHFFLWGVALMDTFRPFLPQGNMPAKASQSGLWWGQDLGTTSNEPKWLEDWGNDTICPSLKPCYQGPFVLKEKPGGADEPIQLYMKYRLKFDFGGDSLPHIAVSNPKTPEYPDRIGELSQPYRRPSNPRHPSKTILTGSDIRSGGMLSRKALKRVLAPSEEYTSESSGSTNDSFLSNRSPSPPALKKKKKSGSRRPKKTSSPPGLRVLGLDFDLFQSALEQQLGGRLTSSELRKAHQIWIEDQEKSAQIAGTASKS